MVWECHACIQCVLHILAMFTAYFLLSIFSSISSRLFHPDCIRVWVQGHLLGHGLCSRGCILEENRLSSQLLYLTVASQFNVGDFLPISVLHTGIFVWLDFVYGVRTAMNLHVQLPCCIGKMTFLCSYLLPLSVTLFLSSLHIPENW